MKIQKLPEEAISKLESGIIIADVAQCVLELVYNSLDAEATGVAVRIDLKNYQIRVTDNGKGIQKEDFVFVGEKFMTSKYYSFHNLDSAFPKYGFKGQALSSLKDVCKTLTIESKSREEGPALVKVFENNKVSEIFEINNGRNGTGTTVTVEDFMCTMPVRRRRINEVFDIEEVKSQLQYLAVIHYRVCFTLRNDNKGIIVLQTPQASNMLESISNIFGKTVAESLKALHYKEKEHEVTGFISLKPQIQSTVQLLYVNQRIISKGSTHKFVNHVIKEYVGKHILHNDTPVGQVLKTLKNCCHNIFIVNIQCPRSQYELFPNLRKTTVEFKNWKNVLKCLQKAIKKTCRGALNFDKSSSVPDNCGINYAEKNKCGGIFGASVLMNAVKGAPVKRRFTTKKDKKKKKRKLNKMQDKPYIPQTESYKNPVHEELIDLNQYKEISNDSLESPIPKELFKNVQIAENTKLRNATTFNQIFEFYEWMMAKRETDENILKLYNDFLKFNIRDNHPPSLREEAHLRSPVLGGKLKRKKMVNSKKFKKKLKKMENKSDCLAAANEKMEIMTRQQVKIFSSSPLKEQNEVQFTKQRNDDFFDNNLNCDLAKTNKDGSMAKMGIGHSLTSLNSSEMQLTNIIKFRNWSETFLQQQPSDIQKDLLRGNTYGYEFGTWKSHYQDFASKNVQLYGQRCSPTVDPLQENDIFQSGGRTDNRNFKNVYVNTSPDDITTKKAFQDVEIQVSLSNKVNTMVQTSPKDSFIQNSYSIKSSDGIDRRICNATIKNAEIGQSGAINSSQEIPKLDFLDVSAQSCYGKEPRYGSNEIITKFPEFVSTNEKISSSSQLLCGQKSNSVAKLQNEGSLVEETQTLAAIWAESLSKIINTHTTADSNSKLESTIPKTIPLEEIQCNILRPIESSFCLIERHDFVPKGLSPSFIHSETNKTFTLSPSEKSKLKVTVDSARSDLLAAVKWQDEFTGDYLKPTIPNGILDEMRLKAEKNLMNFGNKILSGSLSYCAIKVHSLLHSFAFTKELLSNVEVLGQLDKKFIVTKMKLSTPKKMELISLFDQHAVDERIKLEELLKDYSSPDGKYISSRLNSPVEVILNESDIRILCDFDEKLSNLGLNVKKVNESTVSINAIPTFLLNKHEKDVKNKKEISLSEVLKALILNIVEEIKETRGALPKLPKVMHNAFCSEACHKAIKFNRELSADKMKEMIDKLKSCKLPFQCAHGRPSVIPIIDLQDCQSLIENNESIMREKIKEFRVKLEKNHQNSKERIDSNSL